MSIMNNNFSSAEHSEKINVNGIEIYYKRVGNGPHTLFMLAGFLGTSDDFKPLIEYLDHRKYTMIVWDPPGCGRSRPPDIDFSPGYLHREAEYAISLMEALRIDRYSLLGWCQGGCTALVAASRAAGRVNKLVVWNCNAVVTARDLEIYEAKRDFRNWPEPRRRQMVGRYGERYPADSWNAWVDSRVRTLREDGGDVCRGELSAIVAPTLVLHGAEDRLVPVEHSVYLRENIRGATARVFPDGKHALHFMPDDSFNAAVDEFLTTTGSR